jgi:hypothetical protein
VFPAGVRLADEQNLAPRLVAGHEDENRLRLVDAREIEKIAVLAIFVLHIEREGPCGRAPEDRERIGPDPFHRPRAARFEIVLQ